MAVRQRQIRNTNIDTVANLGALATLEADELIYVEENSALYEIRATADPADGTFVLNTGAVGLQAHAVLGVGTGEVIGSAATYAGLPDATAARNNGKFAILTARDGANRAGFYQSDGSDWNFVDVHRDNFAFGAAPTVTDDSDSGYRVGDIWVDTSVNPRRVYVCLDATAGTAVWEDVSTVQDPLIFKGAWDASSGTFPGGGDAEAGYIYVVSVAGEVDGVQFDVGDHIYAIVDNADVNTYVGNWQIVQGVVPDVGKVIAVESTVAAFPAAADYAGWLAFLDVQDGANKPGFYLSDGTDWNWVDIDDSRHTKAGAPDATDDDAAGYAQGDTLIDTADNKAYVAMDVTTGAAVWKRIDGVPLREQLTVTAQDTLSALSETPEDTEDVKLIVNGVVEHPSSGAFTVAGTTITWSAINSGYTLETTDHVMAEYLPA